MEGVGRDGRMRDWEDEKGWEGVGKDGSIGQSQRIINDLIKQNLLRFRIRLKNSRQNNTSIHEMKCHDHSSQ